MRPQGHSLYIPDVNDPLPPKLIKQQTKPEFKYEIKQSVDLFAGVFRKNFCCFVTFCYVAHNCLF